MIQTLIRRYDLSSSVMIRAPILAVEPVGWRPVKTVLLLGRLSGVVEGAQQALGLPDLHILTATGLDDVRAAFAGNAIDHVVMGAGLELDVRLEVIRAVFTTSQTTTVHMKDFASGPDAFLPFARAVLQGLSAF